MTAIFSTAYFPPTAYLSAITRHRDVLIEAKETFPKQTYRNRTEILTAGGVRTITVPVKRNNHSRTEEVTIDYSTRWNIIHIRTLTAAYSASPYFLYYKDTLEEILMHRYDRLLELNMTIMEWLLKQYKIECNIALTDNWNNTVAEDYRNVFTPKAQCTTYVFKPYYQVFADRLPFVPNLSALDLLMNMGPEAKKYLL